jgi:hypothetical protein
MLVNKNPATFERLGQNAVPKYKGTSHPTPLSLTVPRKQSRTENKVEDVDLLQS